jgi:hypothetical protein
MEAAARVCGADNECPIVLTLTDMDTEVPNSTVAQVKVVDAATKAQYGTTPTYAYDAVLGTVTIERYTATASATTVAPSSVQFAVVVTGPDGYTQPFESAAMLVAVDAATATLGAVADGVTLVAGSQNTVPVAFADAVGLTVVPSSALVSSSSTALSSLSSSVTAGTFTATPLSGADVSLVFIVAPTRRRIAVTVASSAILVWPASPVAAPTEGAAVGVPSPMSVTLAEIVPSVVRASFGAPSPASAVVSDVAVTGATVAYTLNASEDAQYTAPLTLSVGTLRVYSRTYDATVLATAQAIYAWPSAVVATLDIGGAQDVRGFAAARQYGSVKLALQGLDTNTTTAVASTGAVKVYVGNVEVPVAVSYVYDAATHAVTVTSMTLGAQTGAIHFGVEVTAPSGQKKEIFSSAETHVVYAVPDTVRLETITDGISLVAGRATSAQFVFSHTNTTVNGNLAALAVPSVHSVSPPTTAVALGSFASAKVLDATITASSVLTTITLMFESTRTVVLATVAAGAIYTLPATAQCVATRL